MSHGHVIDGVVVHSGDGRRSTVVDPATEEPVAEAAHGGAAEVHLAVAAAERALAGPWSRLTPTARGQLLTRLAALVEGARDELAALETGDMGKPLRDAAGDVDGVVATLLYNAGAADKLEGTTIPLGLDFVDFTLPEPLGVTAHIVPWNYPLGMVARSLAPALAAGCTAVVKPAEQSPRSALRLALVAREAGFPDGVINVVAGDGEETGQALIRHPGVRGVTFTGSVETGRAVMAAAATGPKPVVLELGGKNPIIAFADADLDRLVEDLTDAAFGNAGQVCSSCSRLLVERRIAAELTERLAARAARITVGPGRENPDIGPLISSTQRDAVLARIAEACAEGARLVLGGGRPAHLPRGWFVQPTILDQVSPEQRIACEETFGPVLTITPFDDPEEALRMADGLRFGLVAGVYTRDIGRALGLARRLESGSVWINGWFIGGQQAPTGGIKDSGIGRERGLPGLRNYLQTKNVGIRL